MEEEFIKWLISMFAVPVAVAAYFMYRDFRFNMKLVESLTEITVTQKAIHDELKKG